MLAEIIIVGLVLLIIYYLLNNNRVETYTSACANPTCNCYDHDLYPCDSNCQKAKYEVCLIGGRC